MMLFVVLTLGTYLLMHLRPTGFMPDEDQGYLISLVTLPLGASLQRTEAITDGFSKQMREQPEVESTFAITGLNVLTGTNSSYAATMFTILKPWAKRSGAKHSAQAVAARANGSARVSRRPRC